MELLNTKMLKETDFFKVWLWLNELNLYIDENPAFYYNYKDFYQENLEAFNSNEKLQDIINICKTKTFFYHKGNNMTQEMIKCFNDEKHINSSIRLAVEESIRFNSKIFAKLIQQKYVNNGFDFNYFLRQSLRFTDFSIKNEEITLERFSDINLYKRQDFMLQADPNLTVAIKLKRYGFPHQSFYNFIDNDNKSIPRKKLLVQLCYFFLFNMDMMESLMNLYGYTIKHSSNSLDEVIKYGFLIGISFENIRKIASIDGYHF